jgi:beta-glucosidase
MDNRTYRYFKGDPLYGFGYGLSYTSFYYDQLKLPAVTPAGKKVSISARVTNSGKRDGEEVVQLYIASENTAVRSPIKALKGFKRISLKAGESKRVQFELNPQDLSTVDESGRVKPLKGKIMISIGGSQPGEKNKTSGNIVRGEVKIG